MICPDSGRSTPHTIMNLGHGTNNIAEWAGLLWAVMWAKDKGINEITVFGDSQLIINQASGKWKAKDTMMSDLRREYHRIVSDMIVHLRHVPRNQNLAGIHLERIKL